MQALPQEIIDQIVGHVPTQRKWDSIRYSDSTTRSKGTPEELWHHFIHADFKQRSHGEQCAPDGYPTVIDFSPSINVDGIDNVKALRLVSLISRKWNCGVQNFMRKHRILTVDLDRTPTIYQATALIKGGEVVTKLMILAGERHTRPTWRWHGEHPYDVEATLADFWDEPHHPDSKLADVSWPHPFLRTLPKPDRNGRLIGKEIEEVVLLSSSQRADLLANVLQARNEENEKGNLSSKTSVTTLSIKFPGVVSWTNPEGPCRQGTGRYDMAAIDNVLSSLRTTLSGSIQASHDTLQDGLCAHIVDLRLEIPGTRHFARLLPADVGRGRHKSLFPSLKSLYVRVTDASGPSGSGEYVDLDSACGHGYPKPAADPLDGTTVDLDDTDYMTSNLQIELPNREHQDDLWRFVAACRSIESLCIKATHFLGLDRLVAIVREDIKREQENGLKVQDRDWTRTGLKRLSLSRLYTDTKSLIYLLGPKHSITHPKEDIFFEGPQSPIQRLNLDDVKLYTSQDFWADLFEFLLPSRCPDLEVLGIYYLTYFQAHRSSQHPISTMFTYAALFSESWWDWSKLRELLESNRNILVQGEGDRMWGTAYFSQKELEPFRR